MSVPVPERSVTIGEKTVTFPDDRDALYLRWANGNKAAANLLSVVGRSCQLADDLVDEPDMSDASGRMLELQVLMAGVLQTNEFYNANRKMFEPVIVSALLYWDLANTLERSTSKNDRIYAYAYRELVEQVVGIVALLTGGVAHARRSLLESHAYHHVVHVDTFEEYDAERHPTGAAGGE